MSASEQEAREFAVAFTRFLDWVHGGGSARASHVVSLVGEHLGAHGLDRSVVTRALPPFEHVNLQLALEDWMQRTGRAAVVHGVSVPPHYAAIGLQQLLDGEGLPPVRLSAPPLVDLPSGPGRTHACLQSALVLVEDDRGNYVLMLRGPVPHQEPTLSLEVAGLAVADAQAVLAELDGLRAHHNVFRGHVLELGTSDSGELALAFAELPLTERDDVVLPETVLQRIERHTVDVAAHRDSLRAAGQHLKRGLLLFGPPGTGKTHTTRYVVGRMTGCTVLLLSGRSMHLIGAVAGLARQLQPTVVVLEDVDLVAEDRGFGPGANPVLFELLDAMDGAAADADLLFLLTTNRADLLEPALAARPGRVDVAVEIGLPDAEARRRLLELYSRGVPLRLAEADVAEVVERTDGVTAAFLKELIRRAVLESLTETAPLELVSADHVRAALSELLASGERITRVLLGITDEDGDPDERLGVEDGW
ncbi:AAA family ATPase [Aquipuribacter nitratireducens]|uniref:AAA family ATPase n=1 Tax=Aquipuribacter nitratireducens TaxID=650104 RepID=A0ABW0GTQ6_9MICO